MFPELDARRADAAAVITGQLLAVFLEEMLRGDDGRAARIHRHASATAAVVFPDPT